MGMRVGMQTAYRSEGMRRRRRLKSTGRRLRQSLRVEHWVCVAESRVTRVDEKRQKKVDSAEKQTAVCIYARGGEMDARSDKDNRRTREETIGEEASCVCVARLETRGGEGRREGVYITKADEHTPLTGASPSMQVPVQ